MAENEEYRRKRKSTRRSSILKMPRSPRSALCDVDQNVESEEENTVRRKSRRVSFAETLQVKEFLKDNGNQCTKKGQAGDPLQMMGSEVSNEGLATLLTGAIENEVAISVHRKVSVSSTLVADKIDTKDFLNNLTCGQSQASTSHIHQIKPPIIPERRHSPSKEPENDNVFLGNVAVTTKPHPSFMEQTQVFTGDDDAMELTGVPSALINVMNNTVQQKSYSNVTWANESTKVFASSMLGPEEQTQQMDFTTCVGKIMPSGGCTDSALREKPAGHIEELPGDKTRYFHNDRDEMELTRMSRDVSVMNTCDRKPGWSNETLAGDKTRYFQNDPDEMELTGMNHDVSVMGKYDQQPVCSNKTLVGDKTRYFQNDLDEMELTGVNHNFSIMRKRDTSILACSGDFDQTSQQENSENPHKIDAKSFLAGLQPGTDSSTSHLASDNDDGKTHEMHLRNKTTLLSESMDLTTCVSESPAVTNKSHRMVTEDENVNQMTKIDSRGFLSQLAGESNIHATNDGQPLPNTGRNNTGMVDHESVGLAHTLLARKNDEAVSRALFVQSECGKVDTQSFLKSFTSDHTDENDINRKENYTVPNIQKSENGNKIAKIDAKSFLRNIIQDKPENLQGSKEQASDNSVSRKERKGLSDITHTYSFTESSGASRGSGDHTIYFNQENAMNMEDGPLENTECVGGILSSPTVSNTTKSGNKTVCFSLEHTVHHFEKVEHPDQEHLEKVIAEVEARQKEQNKTLLFANESCLMEETACTGKLMSSDENSTTGDSSPVMQKESLSSIDKPTMDSQEEGLNNQNYLKMSSQNYQIASNEGEGSSLKADSDGSYSSTQPDVNKTMLYEECPMEETCMTGILKRKVVTNQTPAPAFEKTVLYGQTKAADMDQTACVGVGVEDRPQCGNDIKENFEKTKIFSELNKTTGGFGMEETVCVGGMLNNEIQAASESDSGHKKTSITDKTIIFSELNKTGAMAMDETACSGKIEKSTSDLEHSDAVKISENPDFMNAVDVGTKETTGIKSQGERSEFQGLEVEEQNYINGERKQINKTLMFDECPMEETCVVGGLQNNLGTNEENSKPSFDKTVMYGQEKGGEMEQTACVDAVLQIEGQETLDKESMGKMNIFSDLNRTSGALVMEETSCVGGLICNTERENRMENTNQHIVQGEKPENVAVLKMEERVSNEQMVDDVDFFNTEHKQLKERSDKTMLFSAMNKTAGLLDETECVGGLMSDEQSNTEKSMLKEMYSRLPNKTIIYGNLDKTSIGLMEETECVGAILPRSTSVCENEMSSSKDLGRDINIAVISQSAERIYEFKAGEVALSDSQDHEAVQSPKSKVSGISVDTKETSHNSDLMQQLEHQRGNEVDGATSFDSDRGGEVSTQPETICKDGPKACANNPLLKLKRRLSRMSVGPAEMAAVNNQPSETMETTTYSNTSLSSENVVDCSGERNEEGMDKVPPIAEKTIKDPFERIRHSSAASIQEGIMGEVLPDLECSDVKLNDSLISLGDGAKTENKKKTSGSPSGTETKESTTDSDIPAKRVRIGLKNDEELNKTSGSLNMTAASGVSTKSFMGNLSGLLPKLTKANSMNASAAPSIREEYDLSCLNVESIDDHLRLFKVFFMDKSRRHSTLAAVSVCPAETVSEAVQLVIYEPQIQTYEWTCEQLTTFNDNCQKRTAESEARLLENVPHLLKNEPGHPETVEILGEMKSQCRKTAILNFKQCKAKMLKAISLALKEEEKDLHDGLQEVKVAELELDAALAQLDQAEAEFQVTLENKNMASDKMAEIKEMEEKKSALDLKCHSLEKERLELSVANEKLRGNIDQHKRNTEELDEEIQRLGSQKNSGVKAKLENLKSISAFQVEDWTDDTGGVLSFLEGSLLLKLVFGKALPQKWYSDNHHREITHLYLESKHKLEDTYASMALQLGVNLMMRYYTKEKLQSQCPDTTFMVQTLKEISVLAAEVGQLVRDLSSHSLSMVHDTVYNLTDNRVTLKVSSLKAWTKFNLVIPLGAIQFPVKSLPWELHTLIGDISEKTMQGVLDSVQPGFSYIRRFIQAVLDFTNRRTTEKRDVVH